MTIIVSSTPYRASLFGGGTDYPEYLQTNPGRVLSFTIKSYSHIILRSLSPVFDKNYRIRYYKRQETDLVDDIEHPIVRYCLKRYWTGQGLDITHTGDLPAMSGMGTSSAFTVGLIRGLHALTKINISKSKLAREAIYIEQNLNSENVGSQDQVAAAYGGFNIIDFEAPTKFRVRPLDLDIDWLNTFTKSLRLVFTGLTRGADSVSKQIRADISTSRTPVKHLFHQVDNAYQIIKSKDNPRLIGELLHEAWTLKRSVSTAISNVEIDNLYERIRAAGAVGGKLLGAGGGGFILAYVPIERLANFHKQLDDLKILPVEIEWRGSRVRQFT